MLLRGINVGGNNKLPMNDLKEALRGLGLEEVSHYIQSGNLVFSASTDNTEALESSIENKIVETFGFRVPAMVIPAMEFESATQSFPFTPAEAEKSVLVFLSGDGGSEWADRAIEKISGGEKYTRPGNVAYMFCPNGIGRSKAAEAVLTKPRSGVKATMRNWRTVNKILGMLSEIASVSETANKASQSR